MSNMTDYITNPIDSNVSSNLIVSNRTIDNDRLSELCGHIDYQQITTVIFQDCTFINNTPKLRFFIRSNSLKHIEFINVYFDMSTFNTMFECSNIKYIKFENCGTDKIYSCERMFTYSDELEEVEFINFDASYVTNMNEMFRNCYKLKRLDLSSFDTHKVVEMNYMFQNCESLENIDFGKHFDTRKVRRMDYMFSNCTKLKQLNLSNFDTRNVISMLDMFCNCNSLEYVNISSFDTKNVVNMSCMFEDCSSLNTLDLSNFDTSSVVIMSKMFRYCDKLVNLIHNLQFDDCNDMSEMFMNCARLNRIVLNKIDNRTNITNIFRNCNIEVVVNKDDVEWMKEECRSKRVKITCEN